MSDLPSALLETIKGHLVKGQKIEAIKVYREHAHCDLKTAKEAVEAIHAKLKAVEPELYGSSSSGCFGLILLLITAGLGGSLWIV